MYGKVLSACVVGIEGVTVEVETDLSNGLPLFQIVGLPDSAVREAAERVRAALKNCGFTFPLERITVNLAPADVRKEGSAFDLAIAAGILSASGQWKRRDLDPGTTLFIGELSLDGTLRKVPGVLPMVHHAALHKISRVAVPLGNLREARLVGGIEVVPIRHLRELAFEEPPEPTSDPEHSASHVGNPDSPSHEPVEDYSEVCGQHQAKRALVIAAAGMHNLLFIGPPGTGKTMLVRRMPTILPELTEEEALEVMKIYSVSGKLLNEANLIRKRPFRAPHHTISAAGLIGGGSFPKPGEVSLAHRGVLFLDELPEFSRHALEVLRQPLEDRRVTIGRVRAAVTYPAQFILAASMNPCPCGYYGDDAGSVLCTCPPLRISQYRAKISGPLLDRIDLHVEVPRTRYTDLAQGHDPVSSAVMKEQVLLARQMQAERYKGLSIHYNSELSGSLLRRYCRLTPDATKLLQATFEALGLSVRAHDRILKLARTIADLEGSDPIEPPHVAEAIQYRTLDKQARAQGMQGSPTRP